VELLAPRRRIVMCVAALLLVSASLVTWQALSQSETYDEPMYILSAYSYVVTGDYSLNREHPPLAKDLMGLPLLPLHLDLPKDYQVRPGLPMAFLCHQPNASARTILFLARLPGVLLMVVLGLYAWRWARLAFGETAGLAALALAVLNPNLLAHAAIATNDFAVTVFGFATCYHAWRWLTTGHRASALFTALLLGAAIGCKLTALVLVPVLGLVVLGVAIARRRPIVLLQGVLIVIAAAGVLWLLYGGEARSLAEVTGHPRFAARGGGTGLFDTPWIERALRAVFGDQVKIPLLSFIKGIDLQLEHARYGHVNFWHGRNSRKGSPEFYAVSWLIKNPEACSLLLLLGVLAWRRTWRGAAHETLLWLYPLLLFVIFSRADVQLGFKYVLPVVPFLAVAASRWLAAPAGQGPGAPRREVLAGAALVVLVSVGVQLYLGDKGPARWSHAVPWIGAAVVAGLLLAAARRAGADGRAALLAPGVALLLWAGGASLLRQPHDLVYFNEWVGGPENGTNWSVIGDDFGQDTILLGQWMSEHGVQHIRYDDYGTGDPEVWGVRSTPTFGNPATWEPFTGYCAVHVTVLRRFPESYPFLEGKQPVAVLGHTIFVYEITDADNAATAARLAARPPPSAPPPPAPEGG
jgi:4-amino-4-deoxy-L-arabinose transferase-like glycosyltransferase